MDKVVQMIQDQGIEDVLPFFGGEVEPLINYLSNKGLLNQIDVFDEELEEYQFKILDTLLNDVNDEETWEYVISQVSSDLIEDGGSYYLKLGSMDELSQFFESGGRNYDLNDVVKNVLGEDYWDPYYDVDVDYFTDVIENLNVENLNTLGELMVKELPPEIPSESDGGYHTDLFEVLSKEQGDTGLITIDSENIQRILTDKETLQYLFDMYLDEMRGELESLYISSYNNAYTNETYDLVMGELSEFFDVSDKKWETITTKYNGERTFFLIKLNKGMVKYIISKYVDNAADSGDYYGDTSLSDIGDFEELMVTVLDAGYLDYLSFYPPDYADYGYVVKDINENFSNYF